MVRAKFRVFNVTPNSDSSFIIRAHPVYQGDDPKGENNMYWQMTPAGYIELTTVNEHAAKQLEVGKEYYVDFTEATGQ